MFVCYKSVEPVMNTKHFFALATAAAMVAPAAAQEAKLKIATVDMQVLFRDFYKTNDAQKVVNEERANVQKEAEERMATLRGIEENLNGLKKKIEDSTISQDKRAGFQKEFVAAQQKGMALDRERKEFLERKQRLLNDLMVTKMRGILEEIRKQVEAQAKEDNFDYVFDKSGMSTAQVPFLLYTKDATDITEKLLKTLNKDAPADAPKADATPAKK